jgi:ABC-type multidrug transport system fused ATPase/permease subunit
MQSAALRRVKHLMRARSGSIVALHGLALLDSLLVLGLFLVGGLLLGLAETQGVTRLPAERPVGSVPEWLLPRLPESLRDPETVLDHDELVTRTGLTPLVEIGRESRNVVRRLGASALRPAVRAFRPLQDNIGALNTLLILGLLLLLAETSVSRVRRGLAAGAAGRATRTLRNQIHRQMYRLGHSSLPDEGAGPVLDLFTRDVNDVRDGLIADLEITLRSPVLAGGLLLASLLLSPVLTVFLLSLAGLIWAVSIPLDRARQRELDASAQESAVYLLLLHEDLGLIRTVRGYAMEGVDKARFEDHLGRFQEADERRIGVEGRRLPTLHLLVGTGVLLAAGLLGFNVIRDQISLATAFLLGGALFAMIRPLTRWLERDRRLARAARAAEAIEDFLDRKPDLFMGANAQFLPALRERISFENVSLESPTGRPLLSGFSAEVPARTRAAIMGFDEEAKHALACMLPRLIDPKVGRVRIDGIDLRDVTLESLRAQISLILQADLVFSDTVLNNIGLGGQNHTLPKVIEAAKLAHAHHFISELPKGYETIIGPMGHPLDLDQQYRIALARAYLHDPSILVIEEPLTPIDDEIKPLVDDTIDRLAAGRTILFLPHRLSTIRKCDQVIVLHNGRVEAAGNPRDLHAQSKLFRHLQYVEFNQFATGEIEAGQMG